MTPILRIGARGSPLSMAQSRGVQARLAALAGVAAERFPIEAITTTGDRIQDRPLTEAGGKGLFTKELDEALLAKRIDIAIHSAKDLPTRLPEGVALACTPEREDARDAFVSLKARSLRDLPAGAVLGTASLRRAAQARHLRPDLQVVTLRGNVETRLRKLDEGVADATFLALAGLKRLGLETHAAGLVEIEDMPPAAGQGALAVTARPRDAQTLSLLAALNDPKAELALAAERAFLLELDGSCRTPIAAHCAPAASVFRFIGEVLSTDGAVRFRQMRADLTLQTVEAAADQGRAIALALKHDAGAALPKLF